MVPWNGPLVSRGRENERVLEGWSGAEAVPLSLEYSSARSSVKRMDVWSSQVENVLSDSVAAAASIRVTAQG
jgi:hypothetical protein